MTSCSCQLDARDTLHCDVLVSGADAEYFFADVLDAVCGHNSPFKMDDIAATTAVPPPSGNVSDRFLSLWQQDGEEDSSNDSSNEKRKLLKAIEQRLEECVQSQQSIDVYLESYDSFEDIVGEPTPEGVINTSLEEHKPQRKNNKKRGAANKGKSNNCNTAQRSFFIHFYYYFIVLSLKPTFIGDE